MMIEQPQTDTKDLKAIEDYIYSSFNHTEEWKKAEQAYQNMLTRRSCPTTAPENQQKIHDQIGKLKTDLFKCIGTIESIQNKLRDEAQR